MWIKNGKPNPGESKTQDDNSDDEDDVPEPIEEEKPKKKGRFGFLRK